MKHPKQSDAFSDFEEAYKKHFNTGKKGYPYFGYLLPDETNGPQRRTLLAEEVARLCKTDQAHLNTILNRLQHIRNTMRKARKEMEAKHEQTSTD